MKRDPSRLECISRFLLALAILAASLKLSTLLLGRAPGLGDNAWKALLIASANTSTATGFSLFIAVGAPYIDMCSDAAMRRLAPAARRLALEKRDRELRAMLRRRPGILALPLTLIILLSSIMAAGLESITPYLALLLSPHTYLEALGLYAALRGGITSYVRGERGALAFSLAVSASLFLAGGVAEAYLFPRIYEALAC